MSIVEVTYSFLFLWVAQVLRSYCVMRNHYTQLVYKTNVYSSTYC